ncbi:hypothetical protein [Saccharopolyspora sp. NPDC050642]|uniref:hypothetical protein n=1 Tax=Saccharopolyspora sp. NPDC050642 TaxID=3157099 RepID=UPI0034034701
MDLMWNTRLRNIPAQLRKRFGRSRTRTAPVPGRESDPLLHKGPRVPPEALRRGRRLE